MDVKMIHCMLEKVAERAKCELDKGIENIDTKEFGEVADIIKDLSTALYYRTITIAMDDAEYGEDYDWKGAYGEHERKGYRGQPRDSRGRYMSRMGRKMGYEEPMMPDYDMEEMEHMRDMDKDTLHRMYYTEPVKMGDMKHDHAMPDSKYDNAKRGYSEKKEMGKDGPESMRGLEDMLNVVGEDIKELKPNMSAQEKALVKQKLSTWMQTLG